MHRLAPLLVLSLLAAGCSASVAVVRGTDSHAAIEAWSGSVGVVSETRVVHREPAPAPPHEVVRIGGDAPAVRARGPRIDVAFDGADLSNALRMLADRAGVGLVIADDLDGTVSLRLRHVRPLDALIAIAEAHGATVEMHGGIVRVARR